MWGEGDLWGLAGGAGGRVAFERPDLARLPRASPIAVTAGALRTGARTNLFMCEVTVRAACSLRPK